MDFETLYTTRVERCSHETAFNKEEARALYDLCKTLSPEDTVVEIGVEFGRSTTIIGSLAKTEGFKFYAIDAWVGEYSPQAKAHVENLLIGEWGLPILLLSMSSFEASGFVEPRKGYLSLVHIDGDHSYGSVLEDCHTWLPRIRTGGHACFDDYGHDSLPEVYAAVTDYMKDKPWWEFVGRYGEKLGVFRHK